MWGWPRVQHELTQRRVYRLTREDVRTTTEIDANMIKLKYYSIYALFDLGATHFFVASRIVNKLNLNGGLLEKEKKK